MKKVAVLMGSKSDWPVVKRAVETLNELEIENEVHIYSAHRTPGEVKRFTGSAIDNDFGVIIAAAGMAAHLAGAVAAATVLPVIGIPLKSAQLDGMDALLSTVQMPPGIPVATVGIDAAKNAALLAAEIIATGDPVLQERLILMREKNATAVLDTDKELQKEL